MRFIREELNNRVTPIVVRTGQAGKAPEREVIERYDISMYLTKVEATSEKLHATVVNAVRSYQYARAYEAALAIATRIIPMSATREGIVRGLPELIEYDIDYYLSKSEVTADKLFSVIRACLRSSQDISTLLAFGRQLRSFTRALQSVTSVPDLLVFMDEALSFLEAKFDASIVFVHDVRAVEPRGDGSALRHGNAPPHVQAALEAACARGGAMFALQPGSDFDLPANEAGVAPTVRKRIFEPFVTTGIGQGGTGLGLAIVHNIVVNVLRGRIDLGDPDGAGALFVIELPAVVPRHDDEPEIETR